MRNIKNTPTMNVENHPLKVKVNSFEFLFTETEMENANLIKTGPNRYHIIKDGKSVSLQVAEVTGTDKHLQLEMEGEQFDITIKDELDLQLEQMGFNKLPEKHIKQIKAPMPGLVLSIDITEGQEVLAGNRLLILSAMKMENSILIEANGIIKKIHVRAGQPVDKGQLLIELH